MYVVAFKTDRSASKLYSFEDYRINVLDARKVAFRHLNMRAETDIKELGEFTEVYFNPKKMSREVSTVMLTHIKG